MRDAVAVAVLARAPIPGQAKTRLIPRLGPEGAARLQAWLTRRAVATALDAGIGPVALWGAPDCGHPLFGECAALGAVALHEQPGGDLGERMLRALTVPPGAIATMVIGTDCPALRPGHLIDVAERLRRGDDAVFLPAEDGGYVLAGLRAPAASKFAGSELGRESARREPTRDGLLQLFADMPWGGATVMEETRCRLRGLGWCWSEPDLLWDVDRPEDIDRLNAEQLAGGLRAADR